MAYSRQYEYDRAATHAGYKWREFMRLPIDEQAHCIARYRVEMQMQAVAAHDSERHAEMRAKAAQGKRGN